MWKFKTSGQLPANKRNPYVMVSNHESFVDMLLLSHLKMEMKYLSKESFLRIPLVGWMMKMSGDVSLLRGDRSSGAAALIVCEKWLKRKMSVMIFPEGTRSFDGEMRGFKDGAFILAIRTQTPMLPVVVHGTRSALRKSDWRMGDAKAEVRVLEIIETTGMTLDDVPALRERVRDVMIAEIAKMRLAA